MISPVFLILTLVALPLQGLDNEEVEYIRSNRMVAAGDTVTFLCGSPLPHIFIWGFTKRGSDNNMAVAYSYGHGTKVQNLSIDLGHLSVPEYTSSLQIEDVSTNAKGMFTCQALYDEEQGLRATFYFTKLIVVDRY